MTGKKIFDKKKVPLKIWQFIIFLLRGESKLPEKRLSFSVRKSDLSGLYYINAIPRERTSQYPLIGLVDFR